MCALPSQQVKPNVMDNYLCGGYFFSSNFDSGNLGKVEVVRNSPDAEITSNIVHAEFNVWTTPDCYGTPNETPNRTWFFFSIRGGRPYSTVRINVKNLNRQAKLFAQGMQPVMRVGPNGKWERIKDKPIFEVDMDNFCLSFLHRPLDQPHVDHYYAFTYPFTYTECQNMLQEFDKKYKKSRKEVDYIIERISQMDLHEKGRKHNKSSSMNVDAANKNVEVSTAESSPESMKEPMSSPLINEFSSLYESYSQKDLLSEIYYHRELLVRSLERRRVDLITISSFHGIQEKLEDRLTHLFPNPREERCRTFKDKKIIFLSSRVHPGETPSSFVLNGFLNLLLDKKSAIASTLRQMYVFKIVPILNPDGVYRGYYRTDTLGQNLNRMYINPKLEIQPSIYAVKKLIRFYHFGYDSYDEDNNNTDISTDSCLKGEKSDSSSSSISTEHKPKRKAERQKDVENRNAIGRKNRAPCKDYCTSSEGDENITKTTSDSSSNNNKSNSNNNNVQSKTQVFTEKLIPEIKTTTTESTDKKTSSAQSLIKKVSQSKVKNSGKSILGSTNYSTNKNTEQTLNDPASMQHRNVNKKTTQKKTSKSGSSINTPLTIANKSVNKKNNIPHYNSFGANFSLKSDGGNFPQNYEDTSNLFLYIDFHGHASKKGVFMYGNYFSNSFEAVECMLLPRLMSINCHHFHYDACNFSEHNMYRREKRDGLSKEGSGRVAVYKMTGLIKSYTLESNYNTGKYVNILPPRGKDLLSKIVNIIPPKYTPAIYEEVGRSLGPSILDLTNSNSLTRIHNSDYRTIHGLRVTLKNEIERSNRAKAYTTAKVSSQNDKRVKRNSVTSTLPSNETSKENKAYFPWRSQASSSKSKLQTKNTRNVKKVSIKVRPTSLFAKKKPKLSVESSSSTFYVPIKKKVKVSRSMQCMSVTNIADSQNTSNISQKTSDYSCYLACNTSALPEKVEKITQLDEVLIKRDNYLDTSAEVSNVVKTNSREAVLRSKLSEVNIGDHKLAETNASACNATNLVRTTTSPSNYMTISTQADDKAVPSCSNLFLPLETANFSKSKTHDISSEKNAFGGSEHLKLRKKRLVKIDSKILKRKKSKFKTTLLYNDC